MTRTLHHDFLYISLPSPHDINFNTLGGIDPEKSYRATLNYLVRRFTEVVTPHTTTSFRLPFKTCIRSLGIHFQGNSPAFDNLSKCK